jgi:hypothetical protein
MRRRLLTLADAACVRAIAKAYATARKKRPRARGSNHAVRAGRAEARVIKKVLLQRYIGSVRGKVFVQPVRVQGEVRSCDVLGSLQRAALRCQVERQICDFKV